jgi:tetratricopeptide (TPR) repeat protein
MQKRERTLALLLAAAVAAVYARTAGFGYVFDDELYIVRNPGLALGPTWAGVRWAFTSFYHANWHPLTWLAHLADRALFGAGAGPAHLVNAALHALCAALLLRLLHRLTGALWPSAFAAALFALHPLRVESVAWVTERKDPLSAIFLILAVGAYLRYCRRPGPARYGAVVALFALGLMSKPSVVTLPFALLLLDFWPLGRWRPWTLPGAGAPAPGLARLAAEKLPLLALSAGAAALTYAAQSRAGAINPVREFPLADRAGNAVISVAAYLGQTFWPRGLAVYYPLPESLPGVAAALAALLVAGLTAAALLAARTRPWLLAGWLWFLGTLVPVLGLVQVGSQAHADRFTYLPSMLLLVALAFEARGVAAQRRVPTRLTAAAAAMALVLLGAATLRQLGHWRDSEALYTHALAVTGANTLAEFNLGAALDAAGRTEEAVARYRAVLAADPHHLDALLNLALVLDARGQRAEARDLELRALADHPSSARAHLNYGSLLSDEGRRTEAMAHFEQALALEPSFAKAQMNIANELGRAGRYDEAAARYREALRLEPRSAEIHYNFGSFLAAHGARAEAITEYQEALRLDPLLARAHMNLANALDDSGRTAEALEHYREALRLEPGNAEAHYNHAVALENAGRSAEAAAEYRETLRLAPGHPRARARLERLR